MLSTDSIVFNGHCTCGAIRFRMTSAPLFVHCCHCRWCQRESGAAFALNAMIEADRVELMSGEPEIVMTPTSSGQGQKVSRCPHCKIALWSNYSGAGDAVRLASRAGAGSRAGLAAVLVAVVFFLAAGIGAVTNGFPTTIPFPPPREWPMAGRAGLWWRVAGLAFAIRQWVLWCLGDDSPPGGWFNQRASSSWGKRLHAVGL